MKSFLLSPNNVPLIPWGSLDDGIFYEGELPKGGYSLAICPGKYIVVDVDHRSEDKNGFKYIPITILKELENTFNYTTKSGKGKHFWLLYTGNKTLKNTSTKFSIDLRIGTKGSNNGGYVRYNGLKDIRQCEHLIKPSSKKLNLWLEKLFT